MYKYLLQIPLLYVLLCIAPSMALAIDYTAKKSEEKTEEQAVEQCSRNDLRLIKKFNHRANVKLEEYKVLEEISTKIKTPKDAKIFSEKMAATLGFFTSNKFKEMRGIYEKCNMEIPEPKSEQPFWMPIKDEE